jgi:hypothetical protein
MQLRQARELGSLSQDVLSRRAKVRRWRLALFEQGELELDAGEVTSLWAVVKKALDARAAALEVARQALADRASQEALTD